MTDILCACVRVCVNIDVFLTLLYYHDQDAKSSYTVTIDSHIVLLCIQLLFLTYTTQKLLDENTQIAYQKNYQCRGLLDHYVNLHGYVYFIC